MKQKLISCKKTLSKLSYKAVDSYFEDKTCQINHDWKKKDNKRQKEMENKWTEWNSER